MTLRGRGAALGGGAAEIALKTAAFAVCLVLVAVTMMGTLLLGALAIAALVWVALETAIHFLLVPIDCCWGDDDESEIGVDDD